MEAKKELLEIKRTSGIPLVLANQGGANVGHGLHKYKVERREVTGTLDEVVRDGKPMDARGGRDVGQDDKFRSVVNEGGGGVTTQDQGKRIGRVARVEAITAEWGRRWSGRGSLSEGGGGRAGEAD